MNYSHLPRTVQRPYLGRTIATFTAGAIKKALAKATLLSHQKLDTPMSIIADASNTAFGAVLNWQLMVSNHLLLKLASQTCCSNSGAMSNVALWCSGEAYILANCPRISGTVPETDLMSRCLGNIQNCSHGKHILLHY